MKYGSVCSGIEAASAAWHGLGWQPSFFSEIEAFPRAVLAHHYPDVPLHGDFTTIEADQYEPIDLLVGGTPCQSFSIAGLRGGLDDDRGNLALEFLRLADRKRPRWVVWENVPGVLSSNGGRDFGSILGGLGELGYGWAYRVLDAQFFGVAQRRRRVFVVGHLGDWRRAAAVLFERHSLSGHPAPRRETGQSVARSIRAQSQSSHREDSDNFVAWRADVAGCLATGGNGRAFPGTSAQDADQGYLVAQCLTTGTGQRYDAETETLIPTHGGGFDVMAFSKGDSGNDASVNVCPTIRKGGDGGGNMPAVAYPINTQLALRGPDVVAVAFQSSQSGVRIGDTHATLDANNGSRRHNGIATASAVRRLTPRECERLQGFPDDYTAIPYRNKPAEQCPDGPRYKALGNSMAVPVMRWIGERIAAVEAFNAS